MECVMDHIEEQLEKLLEGSSSLVEAARYAVLKGGKRIRPKLFLAVAEDYGISLEQSLLPSLAVELIHSYSLIHDDLPCMDDDDFRRDKPSTHKVFGESLALLAGDFLMSLSFDLITQLKMPAETKVSFIQLLAHANSSMIKGQVLDMAHKKKSLDSVDLLEMYKEKTGALLGVSMQMGATLAGASSLEIKLLGEIGEKMGVAYQIMDDIFDIAEPEANFAKRVGPDSAREFSENLYKQCLSTLERFSMPMDQLKKLLAALAIREA